MSEIKKAFSRTDVAVSFSAANLLYLRVWQELIFAGTERSFYLITPNSLSYTVAFINVFLIGMVIWAAHFYYRYSGSKTMERGLALILLFSFLLPLNALRLLLPQLSISNLVDILGELGFGLLIIFLVGTLIRIGFRFSKGAVKTAGVIYLILFPFIFFTFIQAGWALAAGIEEAKEPDRPEPTPEDKRPAERVVWFVFDELDQRLTFEERPEGMEIPELKSLKEKGFYASAAYPPAEDTILSMPAFTSGKMIAEAEVKNKEELLLSPEKSEEEIPWSEAPNVFVEARKMGARSGMTGCFLPYCRVIGHTLDRSSWQPFGTVELNREKGLTEAMAEQVLAPFTISPFNYRSHAMLLHKELQAKAKDLVADPELDLVLVHWSIPHYPWIYSRAREDFSRLNYNLETGYFDNLALVDRSLRKMRRKMEENDLWDRTHVIISSDHPWRMELVPTYDGEQDPRIPFILRVAGEEESVHYSSPFNTVLSKDLILALLAGEISSPAGVAEWLEKNK